MFPLLQGGITNCRPENETSEMFVQLNWQAVASTASHCAAQKWSSSALSGDAVSVGLELVGW